jgi:hypothetical protein
MTNSFALYLQIFGIDSFYCWRIQISVARTGGDGDDLATVRRTRTFPKNGFQVLSQM